MLPPLVNVSPHFDLDFCKAANGSITTFIESSSIFTRLQPLALSDKILIDASEFLNAIYEDMSVINELITIKKQQALIPEGVCLFYKGYLIVNSLQPKYLSKVFQRCKLHNMFEQPSMGSPQIVVDYFTFNKFIRNTQD